MPSIKKTENDSAGFVDRKKTMGEFLSLKKLE